MRRGSSAFQWHCKETVANKPMHFNDEVSLQNFKTCAKMHIMTKKKTILILCFNKYSDHKLS